MKNFKQTPKQRRKAKAEMAGFKAKLRASNPNHSFEQELLWHTAYFRYNESSVRYGVRNHVIRKGKL